MFCLKRRGIFLKCRGVLIKMWTCINIRWKSRSTKVLQKQVSLVSPVRNLLNPKYLM